MSDRQIDLAKLKEPFSPSDIEWRIGQAGKKRDGGIWAQVLAYVTARAVQDRLDETCGPENWRNEFRSGPQGGVVCGLSIRIGVEWITKWDGADNTDIEAVKGGLSDSMKRAAVQWGIGRYLYGLGTNWAEVVEKGGSHKGVLKAKKQGERDEYFEWNAPRLPSWALPKNLQNEKHDEGAGNTSAKANGTSSKQAKGGQNGGTQGKQHAASGEQSDKVKVWRAKIDTALAPAQLRAMCKGIERDADLTDQQKVDLQETAERRAVERERAIETAGAPPS